MSGDEDHIRSHLEDKKRTGTVAEVAAVFGYSASYLHNLIKQCELDTVNDDDNGVRRIRYADVAARRMGD